MSIQKSMSFLINTTDIEHPDLWAGLIGTYLGDVNFTGDDTWGDYYCMLYDSNTLSPSLLDRIREDERYVTEYDPDIGQTMFILRINEEYRENVVKPFMEGKYSKIDKNYVRRHFNPVSPNGTISNNWMILHKDPILRKNWSALIGIELKEDAEVWSKPKREEEIYDYDKFLVAVELQELNTI